MESVWLWTLGIFFGLWLLLTVVRMAGYQALVKLRVPSPVWALLPNWNLFAPRPGVADYYVMCRDQAGAEEAGPWLMAYGPEPRKWFHGLWNPNKVEAKAVFDLVQQFAGLILQMKAGGEEELLQSAPYLHLLHFVRHLPRAGAKTQTQFSIIIREPANQYEGTLLVSPWYPV
ncbi:MAG: hypothetical protein H6581_30320 [Bacteroidia bacterium]|nr:hypothetical protein [Bacteroidia bacterium]